MVTYANGPCELPATASGRRGSPKPRGTRPDRDLNHDHQNYLQTCQAWLQETPACPHLRYVINDRGIDWRTSAKSKKGPLKIIVSSLSQTLYKFEDLAPKDEGAGRARPAASLQNAAPFAGAGPLPSLYSNLQGRLRTTISHCACLQRNICISIVASEQSALFCGAIFPCLG